MILSDISVKRPVFASVISIFLVVFGLVAFNRLRPIVMTGITTAAGMIPLILSSGARVETRMVIGIVVLAGVLSATLFTLFVVPVAYALLSRRTSLARFSGKTSATGRVGVG